MSGPRSLDQDREGGDVIAPLRSRAAPPLDRALAISRRAKVVPRAQILYVRAVVSDSPENLSRASTTRWLDIMTRSLLRAHLIPYAQILLSGSLHARMEQIPSSSKKISDLLNEASVEIC